MRHRDKVEQADVWGKIKVSAQLNGSLREHNCCPQGGEELGTKERGESPGPCRAGSGKMGRNG